MSFEVSMYVLVGLVLLLQVLIVIFVTQDIRKVKEDLKSDLSDVLCNMHDKIKDFSESSEDMGKELFAHVTQVNLKVDDVAKDAKAAKHGAQSAESFAADAIDHLKKNVRPKDPKTGRFMKADKGKADAKASGEVNSSNRRGEEATEDTG